MNCKIEKLKKTFEFCRMLLNEAQEELSKGNVTQASEKLYKIAEEVVKALAELHELEEYREPREKGRWNVKRLEGAARKLSQRYGDDLLEAWEIAYEELHVRGFHEGELTVENVRELIYHIERLMAILWSEVTLK